MKTRTRKRIQKERRKKLLLIIGIILICIVAKLTIFNKNKTNKEIDAELARAMEYEEVKDGDKNIEGTDYVNFDAFFLRDIDGDGYADNIRGTCRQIGKDDTLYMELNVVSNGRLENGKITVNAENFYFQTAIVKDNEISNNYISTNTKAIELKTVENGTQKLITGQVRSGDYSNDTRKTEAIGNDTSKYSKINSVTLTGTHVADDGTRTEIEKTVEFNVDWYGATKASIPANKNINKYEITDLKSLTNEEGLNLSFTVTTAEEKNELILKESYLEGTMPELNGYAPTKVEVTGTNVTYEYDETTHTFKAKREAKINGDQVTTLANSSQDGTTRYNTYTINATYPIEAYEQIGGNDFEIKIPVKAYYTGYNNPNDEFSNPYKSNEAMTTLIAKWLVPGDEIDIKVGEYVSSPFIRQVVSKENPLKIYNGMIEEELNDTYEVRWYVHVSGSNAVDELVMKESTSDMFIKSDSKTESMENVTSNKGIYFSSPVEMLGEEGWIKVYNDETGEELETFTKDNWDTYTKQNPYYYGENIKHIRVETSTANADSNIIVYNVKVLDDDYITKNYTLEQFENLSYIKSTLELYYNNNGQKTKVGTADDEAYYEMPISIANISVKDTAISTQEEHMNQIITISTTSQNYNQRKWINGEFLVKLPEEIIEAEINNVTISNEKVVVIGYDLYEENGSYFIKILTENEEEATYDIKIDCNITPDPRSITVTKNIELYAASENGVNYYYSGEDKYDVNGNLNTTEKVNKREAGITFVSPNSLLTNQSASNYDKVGSVTIAPRVAKTDKNQRKANVDIEITNNYTSTISEIMILGKIPFEGNTYVISNKDLGSTYSTTMSEGGITIPEELKPYVTVYYSENENPTRDLQNSSNGWTTTPTDWSKVKTYLIDLSKYVMPEDVKYKLTYEINIPEGVNYNEVSYSEHAIYFCLDTPEGKYRTQTEPTRLGFMIAKQFDLELTKYQENTEKKLEGIAFSITEEGSEESKIKVTDSTGKLMVTGLYIERTYIIKEIKTTKDYELLEEEIKFTTYEDENGNPQVRLISGTPKRIESIKEDGKDWKVGVDLEDKVRAKLKIVKTDRDTNQLIRGIKFKITGRDKNTIVTTNSKGEALVQGLYMGEEYTLEETKADGYYLLNPIQVKITSTETGFVVEKTDNSSYTVTTENEIPTLTLNIENEKIPTYGLEITKYEKDKETTLAGAQYKITGDGLPENGETYETDENGKITIDNLYEYVAGKNIDGVYTIEEVYAPEGYAINDKVLKFKATKVDGVLQVQIQEGADFIKGGETGITIEDGIVKFSVEDEPVFRLTKTDKETGAPLEGVKFAIYKVEYDENNNEVLSDAYDTDGNIVGTVENINGKEYKVLTTDKNGQITANMPEGYYKAVEVQTLEGYVLAENEADRTEYFGIGKNKPAEIEVTETLRNNIKAEGTITFWDIMYSNDDGYIKIGDVTGKMRIAKEYTANNEEIIISDKTGYQVTVAIKYNKENKVEWVTKLIQGVYSQLFKIEYDSKGNIIIVGNVGNGEIDGAYTENGESISLKKTGYNNQSAVIYILNNDGKVKMAKRLFTAGNISEYVSFAEDNGYVVVGRTRDNVIIPAEDTENNKEIILEAKSANKSDTIIVKYNYDGKISSANIYGADSEDFAKDMVIGNDGSYVVIGSVGKGILNIDKNKTFDEIEIEKNIACDTGAYILKLSEDLKVKWIHILDGTVTKTYSSIEKSEDGYIVVGNNNGQYTIKEEDTEDNTQIEKYTGSYTFMIKYNENGKVKKVNPTTKVGGINQIKKYNNCYIIIGSWCTNIGIRYDPTIAIIDDDLNFVKENAIPGPNYSGWEIEEFSKFDIDSSGTIGAIGNIRGMASVDINGTSKKISKKITAFYDDELNLIDANSELGGNYYFKTVTPTSDGGYIATGIMNGKYKIYAENTSMKKDIELYSYGDKDGLVVKYNKKDEVEWAKNFATVSWDAINGVIETESGYTLIGYINEYNKKEITLENNYVINVYGSEDGIILNTDFDGNITGHKVIGNTENTRINDIAKTEDGFIIVGYFNDTEIGFDGDETEDGQKITLTNGSGNTGFVASYNNENLVKWAYAIQGTGNITADRIIPNLDGGFYIMGSQVGNINIPAEDTEDGKSINFVNNRSTQTFIANVTSEGKIKNIIGRPALGNNYPKETLVPTEDGGFITIWHGFTNNNGKCTFYEEETASGEKIEINVGVWSTFILKYNADMKLEKYVDCQKQKMKVGEYEIIATDDRGFIAVGGIGGGNNTGIRITKYNQDLETVWYKQEGIELTRLYSIKEYEKGKYIISGQMNNGTVIMKLQETTLSPEVQQTKTIAITNQKLAYQITTEVKGEGGTISGQGEIKYEEVPYKEDSKKDIIVTPEAGYQILSIKVNGEKIQFTPNTDGTVTLNKFISMTSNKHVEVEFTKAGTSALVHHYLLGTGEEYGNEGVNVAENEYISGEIGGRYQTSPKVDLAKYEIVTNKDYYSSINQPVPEGVEPEDYYIPSNSAGELEENQIIVNYYYKERTYKLTVHHYLEGLTEKVPAKDGGVVEDEITENLEEGHAYTTQSALETGKVDRKYKLVMVEGEKSGTITGDTEVTYYYKNTAIDMTVNKTWEDGDAETRPTEITMVLKGTVEDKTEVYNEETILTQSNNWTHTWEQLYTEDENGKEITYKVEEKEVPEGYYISKEEQQENTYTITNSKKGKITITKVDKKDKTKRLSGAEFKIEKLKQNEDGSWEVDNEFMAQIKETGEGGTVEYTNLEHGKYRITETKAPEGYELNTKPQEIEINSNQIDYEIEIQDKEKTELPTAGGRGIYLNIAIGAIIVLAGINLSKKRTKTSKVQNKKSKH